MTSNGNSQPDPASEETPQPRNPKPWRISLLILILVGLGGTFALAWYFIYQRLPQTVAKSLTAILSRPVEVGDVKNISLTSLNFGETTLPPTDEHAAEVTIPKVAVNFTPLKVLTEQALELEVTLINPEIKIEQTSEGEWLNTQLTEQPPGIIEIKLQSLRVENADLSLSPRSATGELQSPVNLNINQLQSQFQENNQRIAFQLEQLTLGKVAGHLDLEGEANLNTEAINLSVTSQELAIAQLANLVPSPLNILAGTFSTDTNLQVFLNDTLPKFEGTAQLNNLEATLDPLKTPFQETNAQIRLSERNLFLENFNTQFGETEAVAQGKINLATGYDLTASIPATSFSSLFSALDIDSPDLPFSGTIEANIALTGALDKPQINIVANSTEPTVIDQVEFRRFQADLSLQGTEVILDRFTAIPQAGGEITAQGNLGLTPEQAITLDVQVQNVPGEVIRSYSPNLPADLGVLNASATIDGKLSNWQNLTAQGEATLDIANGEVTLPQFQFSAGRLQGELNLDRLQPERLNPNIPPQLQSPISGQFIFNADVSDFSPEQITVTGNGKLSIPERQLAATAITFSQGQLNANIDITQFPLGFIIPETPTEEFLSAQFQVNADIRDFDLNTVEATGSGAVTLTGQETGRIRLDNLRLRGGNWRGNLASNNLPVGRLVPEFSQLQGTLLDTKLTAQGNINNLTPEGFTIRGTANLKRILGGNIQATQMQVQNGNFKVVALPENLELPQLSEALQGTVAGEVTAQGNIENLTPEGITAEANLIFEQGLSLIQDSLTTRLRWDGQQVVLEEAEAENFFATGTIAVDLQQQGEEIIQNVDLNLDAQNLDLAALPIPETETLGELNIQGLAGFAGTIQGTISKPQVEGEIRLENFALNRFIFDPEMTGTVEANAEQGVRLNLQGDTDAMQLALLSPAEGEFLPLKPASFRLEYEDAVAKGTREKDDLMVSLRELPLDLLRDFAPLPAEFADQPASGTLEGEVTVNLNSYGVSGELALVNPALGRFNSDRASATFSYLNDTLKVSQAKLIQNESEYRADGRLTFTPTNPEFQANIDIKQGRIEDILSAIQLFELSDLGENFTNPQYGDAADLDIASVSVKGKPLQDQLRRFSEIKALLAQLQAQPETGTAIPPLDSAQGNFTGTAYIQGSSFNPADIQGEWNIDGNNWQWGSYLAETVTVRGSFTRGVLTLLPLRFATDESFINLSGTFGGDNQSAQLQVNKIPVAGVQNLVELPEFIGVSGLINGTATVAGSPQNPRARGELRVIDAVLNEKNIDTVQGSFSYSNSELNIFARGLLTAESEPLTVVGEVPYQLPFAEIPPASENLNLEISLQDEGFALLDVISNGQVTWEEGTGEMNLTVTGPFDPENFQIEQLATQGILELSEASIATAALPEPLTAINSRVNFNLTQLSVEQFKANFGGGEITATGGLALFNPNVASDTLDISLGNLALKLPDIYQGKVAGDVSISGSAIEPEIGGEITLSQGEVSLAQEEATAEATSPQGTENGVTVGFQDLKITLGKQVEVTRQPILNFLADGTLVLNGTLNNIRPDGTINLRRGQVNLGPTQFRLAKGYKQTAIFRPADSLDPTLDVRLATSVSESSGGFSEQGTEDQINTSVGRLQSIRIEALVRGQASELQPGALTPNNDVLTLTSDPNRSQTEIIALLGGGLTSGFGGNAGLGLANLAGSTLFGTFQNTIGDALGLSEFRIFPTLIPTEQEEGEEGSSSTLGFGAEAGVDISNNFSLSVLTIFDANQQFQYSVRYRLSDDILLRGSTDFSNNDSFIFEYETRF